MKLYWRQSLSYLTVIVMEGCWLYAVMVWLNKQVTDGRLSTFGLLLLYPLSFILNKQLQRWRWHIVYLRMISWLAWAVMMLLMVKIQLFGGLPWSDSAWLLAVPRAIAELLDTFKPELLILISSAVLWWLGWRLAYLRINFALSVSEFQFGLVILLITLFITSELEVELTNALPITLTFFLSALLGISINHAEEGASWLSGLYRGHWAGLLLVSIGLVFILGMLISFLVTPDLLQIVLNALKWVWGLITKVILFLISLLPKPEPQPLPELPPGMTMPGNETEEWLSLTMPEAVRSGLRIGVAILFLGLVLVALWQVSSQIFSWLRKKLTSMAEAEIELLPGGFISDLISLVKRILLRILGFRLPLRLKRPSSILPEIASVRQVYRQLLRWAAAGGYPRQISQTPHEYLYTLVGMLPVVREDLHLITQHYVRTRYGTFLPTEDELQEVRQSWHKIKQNRLKKPKSETDAK